MSPLHRGPLAGLAAQLLLLGSLAGTVGLGPSGWAAGGVCAVIVDVVLDRAMGHHGTRRLGPADVVTLARASLACGVAALVAERYAAGSPTGLLVALAAAALLLDAVDGRVARSTGTVSTLGARFDMEVDAFLVLGLAVQVAPRVGAWVLAVGLARYGLGILRALVPRLRGEAEPRVWRKAVAVAQGVALVVAAAAVLPDVATRTLLTGALMALAVSFATEAQELWSDETTTTRVIPVPRRLSTSGLVPSGPGRHVHPSRIRANG